MVSLLIPDIKQQGNNLDVHLQLLNEELKDLWFDDLEIYNGLQNKRFRMQVVLLWSITDFQYMLSFRKVILACPCCMDDTYYERLE